MICILPPKSLIPLHPSHYTQGCSTHKYLEQDGPQQKAVRAFVPKILETLSDPHRAGSQVCSLILKVFLQFPFGVPLSCLRRPFLKSLYCNWYFCQCLRTSAYALSTPFGRYGNPFNKSILISSWGHYHFFCWSSSLTYLLFCPYLS